MRVIARGRQAGKTTELLLEFLGTTTGILLVRDQRAKTEMLLHIRKLGVHEFDDRRVLTYADQYHLQEGLRWAQRHDFDAEPSFYIDDAEQIIANYLRVPASRIRALTLNGYAADAPPSLWPMTVEPTKLPTRKERRDAKRAAKMESRQELGEWL